MNTHMGIMTTISVMAALIADFLFLPPLLMKLEEKTYARECAAVLGTAS